MPLEKYFKDNANLYFNPHELKNMDDNTDTDEEMKGDDERGFGKKTGIQQDSSDDDMISTKATKIDNSIKHPTLQLELVFVNRIIQGTAHSIMSKLLGFDEHPRGTKFPPKKYSEKKSSASSSP